MLNIICDRCKKSFTKKEWYGNEHILTYIDETERRKIMHCEICQECATKMKVRILKSIRTFLRRKELVIGWNENLHGVSQNTVRIDLYA